MKELAKAFESGNYEDKIYNSWESSGYFSPDICVSKGASSAKAPVFSMVLPPPNVTGVLHIGHAAMLAIEDIMARYHRMKGDRTLWLPGTDHAAIATQTKVEKVLMDKGMKDPRKDLGREKFLDEVNKFAQASHDTIVNQCKKMGSSLDWSREAFTLDEKRSLAVKTVFKKMYDDGLIERGYRIVNWCPRCHSTLADDEVEYKPARAKLYWIKYGPFTLATTRPETKLGDTAVAVHPKDKRYKKMVGKTFQIPGVLGNFEIVVVADEAVDPEFGSGAIKVTPAHSFADYDIAQRHKVPKKQIIDEDGRMMANCGKYAGMTTEEARKAVVADMEKMGLIDHIDDNYETNLSVCYRCGTVIEPIPSRQWFIRVEKDFKMGPSKIKGIKEGKKTTLKKLMQAAVREGQVKIIPDRFEKTYFNWVDNLRDWCISRQIWYGHRIPVWYKGEETFVGIDAPAKNGNIIFLHGFYRTENVKDPLRWLNQQVLNINNFCSILPNSSKPDLKEQSDFVLKNAVLTEDTTIVTHSLGGILALKLIVENNLKIKKLVLVAPPLHPHREELKNYTLGDNFDFEKVKHNVKEIIVFRAGNDHVIPPEEITELASYLGAKIIDVPETASHFNCEECREILDELKKDQWHQDPDTLDTWFSSGLWTFSTLGWPNETDDFKNFHPTSVLETGYDILFFWIARMILMSTYALGDIPFETVYLHGLVRDEKGQKMSKSLGNVIDPLDMVNKYGADATRLSLTIGTTPGNDVKLSEEKIGGFRNFTNKLWNICRFMLLNIENPNQKIKRPSPATLADEWVLSKLDNIISETTANIDKYNFSYAGEQLRDFTWGDLADWYLEVAKIEGDKQEMLNYILNTVLKLWHPFMPFVTEAIWTEVYGKSELIVERWPDEVAAKKSKSGDFDFIKSVITGIRSTRADFKIEPAKKINAVIGAHDKLKVLAENASIIKSLARLENLEIKKSTDRPESAAGFVEGGAEIFVDLAGLVDLEKEKDRIKKEISEVEPYAAGLRSKLSNSEFVKNAPKDIVEKEKEKLAQAEEKINKLLLQLKNLL